MKAKHFNEEEKFILLRSLTSMRENSEGEGVGSVRRNDIEERRENIEAETQAIYWRKQYEGEEEEEENLTVGSIQCLMKMSKYLWPEEIISWRRLKMFCRKASWRLFWKAKKPVLKKKEETGCEAWKWKWLRREEEIRRKLAIQMKANVWKKMKRREEEENQCENNHAIL